MVRFNRVIIFCFLFSIFSTQADTIKIAAISETANTLVAKTVLTEAYSQIGYNLELVILTPQDALKKSSDGELDAELQRIDGASKKYPSLIQVPIPINVVQVTIFTKSNQIHVSDWYDLKPYKVGLMSGLLFFEQTSAGINVTKAHTYNELIQLVAEDKIDLAVMPKADGIELIKRSGHTQIKDTGDILEWLFLYHYLHEKNKFLLAPLEKVLKRMLLSGRTLQIRNDVMKKLNS